MSNHHKFINSTSITHCDYDDDKGTLIIQFQSGATYHYHNLKAAKSAGQYFQQNIRTLKSIKQ